MRVADYITQELFRNGVDTIFLLAGGGMMHLVDAAGKTKGLKYICNHHEQSCAMAADGYARQKGGLSAAYATSGPGGTNTITGIVGAYQDATPIVFITGQSKASQTIESSQITDLRQFGTFEVNIVPIVKTITKYAIMITEPSTVRYHLEKAIHLARSGKPGPVLLDVPLDIQGADMDPEKQRGFSQEEQLFYPSANDIDLIVGYLIKAKRPLILAGQGVRIANSHTKLGQFAEKLSIPVVLSQLGKDVLPYDDPCFVGHPGPKGDRPGNFAIQTADLILTLGCSLHSQTTGWEADLFAPEAVKIMVDIDLAVLARQEIKLDMRVHAGVAEIISALDKEEIQPCSKVWLERCCRWKKDYAVNRELHSSDHRINFYAFADALSNALEGHETVVTDAGSAFYVMGQAFRVKGKQRFISSGSLGAMGFALPAAVGAALAAPERMIISVTGDGSLMPNMHDLSVMSYNKLNLKLFIINNEGYVSIRNTQHSFFEGHQVGTDADSGIFIPKIGDLAKAFQLPHLVCHNEAELNKIIKKAASMKGPVICEIIATQNQQILPSVTSIRLENGKMMSQPIHNMSPVIPIEELQKIMGIGT